MNLVETESVIVLPRDEGAYGRIWLWQGLVLLALVGFIYHGIFAALVVDWWNDPNFSHGFFVPLFSVFVAWKRRKDVAALPLQPSAAGLVVIAGALMILVVGVLGVELFLSRASSVFLLAGMIIYFGGWRHFKVLLFPWAALFLMIPIPVIIFNEIAFPLQFLASRLATWFLIFLEVPVLREGNVIHLSSMSLEVVEACSGIRSLVSLITLAVIYGYVAKSRYLERIALTLAAIPIAVIANGLRIMGTGILGEYWNADKAEGFFHAFSGWILFLLSFAMFFVFHWAWTNLQHCSFRKRLC